MLEIIVVVFLCIGNSKRAKERNRSGGGAVAYTLGLWIGLEFFGAILGSILFLGDFWATYILALLFAITGGIISYFISKQGDRVEYIQPHVLTSSCTIRVFRDASEISKSEKFFFYLNGQVLDALENDSMLIANTKQSHNVITVRIGEEQFMRDTYQFMAYPDGVVDVHCSGGKFQPQMTKVIAEEKSSDNEW